MSVESILARLDNNFNISESDYIPRVAAWCIDAMNQMKCLKYEERSSTSPVEERRAIMPHCAIANLVRIFDGQGCEILKAKKSNCCNTYSRREIFQLDKDKYDATKSKRTVEINTINYTGRNYISLPNNMVEFNFDIDSVTFKYLTVKTYFSDTYNCDLPYIPNNGKLVEALVWYCMYMILLRGQSHPVFSLKGQLPTNPYLMWEKSRAAAITSVIIDNQEENGEIGDGWNSFFYNSTFKPRS